MIYRRRVSLKGSLNKSGGFFGSEFSLPVAVWFWVVGEKVEVPDATDDEERSA